MAVERFAVMSILVRLGDGVADSRALVEAVRGVAGVETLECVYANDYEQVSADNAGGAGMEFWVYISPDDDEPYMATQDGGRYGVVLADAAMGSLRQHAVVTAIHVEHPRADRYGSPLAGVADYYAATEASGHGFRVAAGFEVDVQDTGDDSATSVWLKLRVDPGLVEDAFPEAANLAASIKKAGEDYLASV